MTDESGNESQAKSKKKENKSNDSRYNINKRLNSVIDLYIPLTICAITALIIDKYLNPFENVVSLIHLVMYNDNQSIMRAKNSQYNGSINSIPSLSLMLIIVGCFLAFIVITTSLLVFLYVKGYKKWIEYFFWGQIFITFMVTETKIISSAFFYYEIQIDDLILLIISVIFSIVGVFSINGFGPKKLRQFFHITLGVNIALLLCSLLPEWIIWLILFLLSIWDLVAVLWKKGPLNILVNTASNRNEELFSALVYSCMAYSENINDNDTKNEITNNNNNKDKNETELVDRVEENTIDEEESNGAKLGMGDFVFYTLLIVHVSKYNNPISLVNCIVAILTGLTMTMFILVYFKRALPALPISIFSSIIFFFGTYYLGSPFYKEIIDNNIFI